MPGNKGTHKDCGASRTQSTDCPRVEPSLLVRAMTLERSSEHLKMYPDQEAMASASAAWESRAKNSDGRPDIFPAEVAVSEKKGVRLASF